jgi:hypothetical protein
MTCTAETGRQAGCQLDCERLAEWDAKEKERRERAIRKWKQDRLIDDFRADMIIKTKRRSGK